MKPTTLALLGLSTLATAFQGDMTYYAPGLGSCGLTNTESDHIVALSVQMMDNAASPNGNPNRNPKCGTMINIYNPTTKTTHQAKVVDTCEGCADQDIDVSPSLFQVVAPDGDGRYVSLDTLLFFWPLTCAS